MYVRQWFFFFGLLFVSTYGLNGLKSVDEKESSDDVVPEAPDQHEVDDHSHSDHPLTSDHKLSAKDHKHTDEPEHSEDPHDLYHPDEFAHHPAPDHGVKSETDGGFNNNQSFSEPEPKVLIEKKEDEHFVDPNSDSVQDAVADIQCEVCHIAVSAIWTEVATKGNEYGTALPDEDALGIIQHQCHPEEQDGHPDHHHVEPSPKSLKNHTVKKHGNTHVLVSQDTDHNVGGNDTVTHDSANDDNATVKIKVDTGLFAMNEACHKCIDLEETKIQTVITLKDRELRNKFSTKANFTKLVSAQEKGTRTIANSLCKKCCSHLKNERATPGKMGGGSTTRGTGRRGTGRRGSKSRGTRSRRRRGSRKKRRRGSKSRGTTTTGTRSRRRRGSRELYDYHDEL